MQKVYFILALSSMFLLFGCDKEEEDLFNDPRPQGISDVRWVDRPGLDNEPTGKITDGSRHKISIQEGFHLNIDVRGEFSFGEFYFLVNDEKRLKEQIIIPEVFNGPYDGSISYIFRVDEISLGDGEFYKINPGDTYHFYYTFIATTPDSIYSKSWIADIVE